MGDIDVRAVGAGDWDAVEHALSGGGDGASCWCQWFLMTSTQWSATSRDDKRAKLRAELDGGTAPGLVAFVDGVGAGWCRVGPRTAQPRLARSRIVRAAGHAPLDSPDVWAVTCFVVRREHRGRGLQGALLAGAIAFARASGATRLEGYPVAVEPGATEAPNELYHGTLGAFERAGFALTGRPTRRRAVVALDLTP